MLKSLIKAAALGLVLIATPVTTGFATADAQSGCGAAVSVRPGDTLFRIAARCGVSMAQILRANPQITNPNIIYVGQTIRIRGEAVSQPPGPAEPEVTRYRVRPGDTLARIARRYGISLSRLIAANPRINPNYLFVGQIIRIPGAGAPVTPPAGGTPFVTISGEITDEGVECLAMRDDRGRLYTLVGNLRNVAPGDEVEVRGIAVPVSHCQQGRTIDVARIRHLDGGGDGGESPFVRVRGVLTDEGVECQAMRGFDGRLYTLTRTNGFDTGDVVEVRGTVAEVSFCQQGTTIDVQQIVGN